MPQELPGTMNMLGVPVSAIDLATALGVIDRWIEDRSPNFVCIRDVHGIMASQDDEAYRRIHYRSRLVEFQREYERCPQSRYRFEPWCLPCRVGPLCAAPTDNKDHRGI